MKIGLLCEGDSDERPLQIIIERIISELRQSQAKRLSFVTKSAQGSIESLIRISAILFYNTNDCDLAVFITDSDGKSDKCKRIKSLVSTHCKRIRPSGSYIVACPDTELEQWLLDEENAIKQIFSLAGNLPLPYEGMTPKERLLRIIHENGKDITVTESDMYAKVAALMNLKTLCMRNKSFKSFYDAIRKNV